MIFDFLDSSALRNSGRGPHSMPKNGNKDVALLKSLAINNPLSAIPHVREGVSIPSDRLQDHPVCVSVDRIPIGNDLSSNRTLRLDVAGRGDEYVIDFGLVWHR